jgi:hypothetical protein
MPEYSDNVKDLNKQLSQAGIALQEAGAEAINKGAMIIAARYKRNLRAKSKHVRNPKFTFGSIIVLQAHAKRSDGTTLREAKDINAITGVKQLRGQDHYLARREEGGEKKGNPKTGGRVPIPLTAARGGSEANPISPAYRLSKATPIQFQGEMRNANNALMQIEMLHGMIKKGQIQPGLYQTGDSIYKVTKTKVIRIRNTEKQTVQVPKRPLFETSVGELEAGKLETLYITAAKRLIDEKVKASKP